MKRSILFCGVALSCALVSLAAIQPLSRNSTIWNAVASQKYLDGREAYWQGWNHAARDHETHCVSCHTQVPYALSRSLLRERLHEQSLSIPEQKMVADITKRVTMWNRVEPFYTEPSPTRGTQARGTESVLNALILTCYDVQTGHLSMTTRKAFDNAWALQFQTGSNSGSWAWLNFQTEPWEGVDSAYQGATYFALAVGMAPEDYQDAAPIQSQLSLLRSYLNQHYSSQPLANKLVLLWASSRLKGLLSPEQQKRVAVEVLALQHADGGWSLTSFGDFKRRDSTELETKSDGYATGLAVLAIQQSNAVRKDPSVRKGIDWLTKNQNQEEGYWTGYSLNKERDPKTNIGHFMTDAATGFAIVALANNK